MTDPSELLDALDEMNKAEDVLLGELRFLTRIRDVIVVIRHAVLTFPGKTYSSPLVMRLLEENSRLFQRYLRVSDEAFVILAARGDLLRHLWYLRERRDFLNGKCK